MKYISGSLLAVLVFIAALDDAPLLFMKISSRNLLWYLAVLGFIVTLSSDQEKKESNRSAVAKGDVPGVKQAQKTTVFSIEMEKSVLNF